MDILWIANYYGIDLEKAFSNKIDKWNKRFEFDIKL